MLMFLNFPFLNSTLLRSRQFASAVSWLSSLSVRFQNYLCNVRELYYRNLRSKECMKIRFSLFQHLLHVKHDIEKLSGPQQKGDFSVIRIASVGCVPKLLPSTRTE